MTHSLIVLYLLFPFISVTAVAGPDRPPETFVALLKCRSLGEQAARLACYDNAVTRLEAATRNRDVVLIDREHMRSTRRKLFGLPLPDINLFGGNQHGSEEVEAIEGEVAGAHQGGDGNWVVRLRDGAVWIQTDDRPLVVAPRTGTRVVIRRAAMGSFMMRPGSQAGIRVRRAS